MPATPLCRELGIEHPIFSVGFGAAAGPELAAAVSNAGGVGVLGGSSLEPEEIRRRIERMRELTSRPFGVNLIIIYVELGIAEGAAVAEAQIAAAIEEAVPLLVLFCGDPTPYVGEAHRRGVRVAVQVGSVAEAERAAAGGVDIVIAQGYEAGGHVRARTSLLVNLPTIVDAVAPVPVLASGGIADGRGLAAALVLGAQGISLGTRFVASEEAWIPPEYKLRVVEAKAEDTVYGYLFDVGFPETPHRMLRNRIVAEWEAAGRPEPGSREHEDKTVGTRTMPDGARYEVPRYASIMAEPTFEGDLDLVPLWAGESVSLVREVKPAAEIVRQIAREADELIARLAQV
ncbi:MAG: nitronate monooxygenase [Actinobacteria bacterium]|nr:nitronate monooxygenase [Actinomycetota bacterium]